jgi:hypothetical protein
MNNKRDEKSTILMFIAIGIAGIVIFIGNIIVAKNKAESEARIKAEKNQEIQKLEQVKKVFPIRGRSEFVTKSRDREAGSTRIYIYPEATWINKKNSRAIYFWAEDIFWNPGGTTIKAHNRQLILAICGSPNYVVLAQEDFINKLEDVPYPIFSNSYVSNWLYQDIENISFEEVIPGTIQETMLDAACHNR